MGFWFGLGCFRGFCSFLLDLFWNSLPFFWPATVLARILSLAAQIALAFRRASAAAFLCQAAIPDLRSRGALQAAALGLCVRCSAGGSGAESFSHLLPKPG